MENYIIQGSKPLYGEVAISGAKNAVLPILAACLLCKETCVIHNVPFLKDVFVMTEVLEELGAQLKWEGHTLVINCANVIPKPVKWEISQKMRASNLVLGPLLGRFGEGEVAYPGGCSIGARPMDLHLTALRQFGCKIVETAHGVAANAKRLHGAVCRLAFPSVGATENALMAAVLATGETCIQNGAQEPEIIDLVQFLSAMGAKIQRKADGTFLVAGVSVLHGAEYTVMPDRIETGTLLIAGALSGGTIALHQAKAEHCQQLLTALAACGVTVIPLQQGLLVKGMPQKQWRPMVLQTLPYPGFPTDMQPQMMVLLALSNGISKVEETLFENRYRHVQELQKMGANITLLGNVAVISGVSHLTGATVSATDLRAGAALVLAGLVAEGSTTVQNISYIDRGYERLEEKLNALGADIRRVPATVQKLTWQKKCAQILEPMPLGIL